MKATLGLSRLATRPSLESLALLLALAVTLWPIWGNAYFLTNDGPCHLYNARILRDLLLGHDRAFYLDWYQVNPRLDPNWFSHLLLMALQMVVPAVFAEKLLLTLYVLGFVLGFRYLARAILPENAALVLLVIPFAYTKVFLLGFYNFCFSLAVLFFLLGHWLHYWQSSDWRKWLGLGAWLLLLGMTHPVGYAMGLGSIASHATGAWLLDFQAGGFRGRTVAFMKLTGRTLLAGFPSLLLLWMFLAGHETTIVPSQEKFHTLFHSLLQLKALILFQPHEADWPRVLAITVGALLVVGLVRQRGESLRHAGLLVMLGMALYAYFNQPAQVGRIGILPVRLQPLPYLVALTWVVTQRWPRSLLHAGMAVGLMVTLVLGFKRMPDFRHESDAVKEFMTVQDHIRPHSTLLMLDYAPEGRLPHDGAIISREAFLFMHIPEYLGAQKPLIVLNNYEANTDWFPLQWADLRDPYLYLGDGLGFEGWLPTADFEGYRTKTGKDVDYVITWCLTQEFRQYDGVKLMLERLARDYEEVYVSEGERVRLFERRR